MGENPGFAKNIVKIDGYLVQEKLAKALAAIVGDAAWRGREVAVIAGRRQRWDMLYELAGQKVAVEFDGDEHYRHALKIKADREKDELARNGCYRVVRVPYWVQLTTETLCYYFEIDAEIIQNFPHGFIATRFFPASYCELGIARFKRELDALPLAVRNAVVTSLRDRAMEFGTEYVVPNALAHLLDGSG